MDLEMGVDGLLRCQWGAEPEINRDYHDEEWGRATTEDRLLFEKICLEGFQAGLSWLTILRKRDNFREAFSGFDLEAVAGFGDDEVDRLLKNEGIIRHEGKIRSTINNAGRALDLVEEVGSLRQYFWAWAPPEEPAPIEIPAITPVSIAMSKDLKKRGWTFVGPTTAYAFMQAMGLINDHREGCHVREECRRLRRLALKAEAWGTDLLGPPGE